MPLTKEVLSDAIGKAIALGTGRRFRQSVELVFTFQGFDKKSPEIRFRDSVLLPRGIGRSAKILVVADGGMKLAAQKIGVDTLGTDQLRNLSKRDIKKIARRYDWFLVSTEAMSLVGRLLGPALGPRGRAPIPVPPQANLDLLVRQYNSSTWLRNREQNWVGCRIGTEDMSVEDLVENAMSVIEFVKGKIKRPLEGSVRIYVKTTMGPPVEVLYT
ncbi:MAG: 50S ribosomal protein L1 [Sulfolobales archaeon]|nr:50S ribosomal protein L1 [Sulfolobales archaeon]